MKFSQFSLRRVLLVIALIAIVIRLAMWGVELQRRAGVWANLAAMHAQEASNHQMAAEFYRRLADERWRPGIVLGAGYPDYPLYSNDCIRNDYIAGKGSRVKNKAFTSDTDKDTAEQLRLVDREKKRAEYFQSLAMKYLHASKQPWKGVEPDPDPPE